MSNPPPARLFVSHFGAAALRRLHRASALLLGAFVLLHLLNHVAGFAGQDAHRTLQLALRWAYQGWLEPLLLASCAIQIVTGLRMVWLRRASPWRHTAQPISGAYLALFLSIHVFAVMQARWSGTETDLAFAAAGMHAGAWALFFAPYYGLAVFAFGLHVSVPIGRKSPKTGCFIKWLSAALALALVALLAGWITPLQIAPELIQAFPR
jgi:succinate dehydrogenase/fumarate reductase cytochrome b subunit